MCWHWLDRPSKVDQYIFVRFCFFVDFPLLVEIKEDIWFDNLIKDEAVIVMNLLGRTIIETAS